MCHPSSLGDGNRQLQQHARAPPAGTSSGPLRPYRRGPPGMTCSTTSLKWCSSRRSTPFPGGGGGRQARKRGRPRGDGTKTHESSAARQEGCRGRWEAESWTEENVEEGGRGVLRVGGVGEGRRGLFTNSSPPRPTMHIQHPKIEDETTSPSFRSFWPG